MLERFKNLPWYLLAFIGISVKACVHSIGISEALIVLGLIGFEAYKIYLNYNTEKKVSAETLEKLQGLESKISMMTAYKR
jgi:hypothetical protein